jgi:predicted phage-related endonuclease
MGLTQHQLAMRRTGITATDVRVLSGLDPYGRTPHDVWRSKVLGDDTVAESEAMSLGSELEPIVLRRLAEKRGLHILRMDPELLTIRHPKTAHHLATPDAFFASSAFHKPEAVGQVKVVGLRGAHEWADDQDGPDGIPEHVLIQCAWELYVAGVVVEHVGALIGTEVRPYRIELTPDVAHLIEALQDAANRFWTDHVLTKRPPAIDGSAGAARMLRALFPQPRGPVTRATDEIEGVAAHYLASKRSLAELEQSIETDKQLLITACGDAAGIVGEGWRLKLELREAVEVVPKPYTKAAYRHFDLRRVEANARKRSSVEAA